MKAIDIDQLFNAVASNANQEIEKHLKGDCVFISSGMTAPLDDEFRVCV